MNKPETSENSKLTLSPAETELVTNAEWFLTKRSITDKVFEMFGIIPGEVNHLFRDKLFEAVGNTSPKIFKGENYLGLPWVMLDHPRVFGNEDIFAIRTMFWWANYFSVTLHLKGTYKNLLLSSPSFSLQSLQAHDFFVAVSTNEWSHEVSKENYIPAKEMNDEELQRVVNEKPFLKIASTIPLTEWNNAVFLLPEIYRKMVSLFGINYPAGEKVL